MCVCIGVITLLKQWQNSIKEDNEGKEQSQKEQALTTFLSILSSCTISFINDNLIKTIRRFTDFERHETITKINVSVAVKLTIARFLNTSVILLLTNDRTKGWFKGASLAYDATLLISIMAFQTPVIYALNIGGRLKKRKIRKLIEQQEAGEDVVMTQREANTLCEGPQIDVPNILSKYFVLIMACIFYAPLIPLALPIACIGSLLTYMSYKYMLLRVHKMPEMFGDLMATFFASLMPAILVVWALSYWIFVRQINMAFQKDFNSMYNCDLNEEYASCINATIEAPGNH